MTIQPAWPLVIFCTWEISSLKVMLISLAARNLSVHLILSSDSFPESLRKLATIPSMTTLVLMMKTESSWTVSSILESSLKIISKLKKFPSSQKEEKTLHLISISSWKLQAQKKKETTLGESLWLIRKTTTNFFTHDLSKLESTKSEVLPMPHGTKSNATWLETILLTSSKLLIGWNHINQPTGKN